MRMFPLISALALVLGLLGGCAKSRSQDQSQPAMDSRLTGYWELQNVNSVEDVGAPFRMRFFINGQGVQEVQFCSVNGSQGFAAWKTAAGAHVFTLYPYPGKMQAFSGRVLQLQENSLILNPHLVYRRLTPSRELLATDTDASLCKPI